MRICLVRCPAPFLIQDKMLPPLGLMAVGTALKTQGHDVTLTAVDADDDVVNLDGKTVHFYYRDPSGNESIDTSPTIADATNGQVLHSFAADDLDEAGMWSTKLYITTDQISSTRYDFRVYDDWER